MKTICVYCGCSDKINPSFFSAAEELGKLLALRSIELVYGAGKTGLMGTLADGVLNNGGKVHGVLPENLNQPQLIHAGLSSVEVVDDIQLRKSRMAERSDAFIALPGGFGTLDEFLEVITWAQLGLHQKPIGLLNSNGYYDPLLKMFENALTYGFIYPEHLNLIEHSSNPAELLSMLESHITPPDLERWITRE